MEGWLDLYFLIVHILFLRLHFRLDELCHLLCNGCHAGNARVVPDLLDIFEEDGVGSVVGSGVELAFGDFGLEFRVDDAYDLSIGSLSSEVVEHVAACREV